MIGRIYRRIKTTIYKMIHPVFRNAVLYEIPRVYFKNRLKLGRKIHINDSVFINAVGGVEIGDYSVLSHGCSIISTGLNTDIWKQRKEDEDMHIRLKIKIGKNVWLGANTVVLAGVEIANNSIVAAGAVVNRDLPEKGCLYGGIPIRKLKELDKGYDF